MCFDGVETEQHFLIECTHAASADARRELWQQLDRLVNEFGAAAATAESTLFSVSSLTSSSQLTLMTGGGHPSMTDRVLTRRVMSAILIALGSWMHTRKQHNERIKEFEAMEQLADSSHAPSTPCA
jgi:hypothetical protein